MDFNRGNERNTCLDRRREKSISEDWRLVERDLGFVGILEICLELRGQKAETGRDDGRKGEENTDRIGDGGAFLVENRVAGNCHRECNQ